MPVTPSRYPMSAGRGVERLDMAQTGQLALPGLKALFQEPLELMLPSKAYPFCTAGAVPDPNYYLDLITTWSREGQICRYIVTGTNINVPVLLGPITYGEQDGSNDVYVTIPLYEYRYLDEVVVEQTQNAARHREGGQTPTAENYVVQKGDTLWSICKRFYGDGSLAYKLATVNSISNPNLIRVGQILSIPALSQLEQATPTPAKEVIQTETQGQARAQTAADIGLKADSSAWYASMKDKLAYEARTTS